MKQAERAASRSFAWRAVGAGAAAAIAALTLAGGAVAQTKPGNALYKDASAPLEQRVEDLLGRMTLEEKIAQITTVWTAKNELLNDARDFDATKARKLYPNGIGHFARPQRSALDAASPGEPSRDEKQTVSLVNAIQRYQQKDTRLGIPTLFHEESLHGYAARGATSFPQAIALASTWEPELLTRVFTVAAREVRARGAQLVLAPVVDVARDPRWGRIEETYGEDPYLVGEMGVAAVRGFQGDSLPLAKDRVFATLKHMTGHGQPEGGTNVGPANISERILREVFFPPFAAAVKRGNAMAVMPSYNEIDGVPSHANTWLLTRVLREEMGFKGAVVSDYWGVDELVKAASRGAGSAERRGSRAEGRRGLRCSRWPQLHQAARSARRGARDAGGDRSGRAAHAAHEVPVRTVRAALRGCEVRSGDHGQRGGSCARAGGSAQGGGAPEERRHPALLRGCHEGEDARRHRARTPQSRSSAAIRTFRAGRSACSMASRRSWETACAS